MATCFRTPPDEDVFTANWVGDQCVAVVFGLEGRTYASVHELQTIAFVSAAALALEAARTEQLNLARTRSLRR